LTFRRNSTEETTPHNISGLLFAGVVEGLYCDGQISVGQYIHCQDNVLSCDEIAIDQGGSHGCPN
jgi:hypothetical protein